MQHQSVEGCKFTSDVGLCIVNCWYLYQAKYWAILQTIQYRSILDTRYRYHPFTSDYWLLLRVQVAALMTEVWQLTAKDTLENSCILVASVGSVSHLRLAYVVMWIFIPASLSAQNVADVVEAGLSWQYTWEVILERNRLSAQFAANGLQNPVVLWGTAELTMEWSCTNAACVTRTLVGLVIWMLTWESTQETNRTSVQLHCVTKVSASPATCRHMI